MRHGVKGNHLGRTASHRIATLRSLATHLINHKKIKTTLAKAKALRIFVEPLITKAKTDSVHSRRVIARHINDKDAVKELFGDIATKLAERKGGYTRIVKLGQRLGDGAQVAILELVDYNELLTKEKASKAKAKLAAKDAKKNKDKDVQDAQVVEEVKEEKKKKAAKKTEKKVEDKKEKPKKATTKAVGAKKKSTSTKAK
ncbi:MAG: 50S ribosomal protein L17 [bacterium]